MKKYLFALIILVLMFSVSCVAVTDHSDWIKIQVQESTVNSSSNVSYSVMAPPDYKETLSDSSSGVITFLSNESKPDSMISIAVMENPTGDILSVNSSGSLLDSYMSGLNVTPLENSKPVSVDNGVFDYGMNGDKTAGVFILSTPENIIMVSGLYNTIEDATADAETLGYLAGTITFE